MLIYFIDILFFVKYLTYLWNKISPKLISWKTFCKQLMIWWWRQSIRGNIIMEVNSSTKQSSLSKEKIQKKGFKVKVDQGEHHYRR